MARDATGTYHIPAGTDGVPDTVIESNRYNTFIHDVENDLNYPRPVVAGGTGAATVAAARAKLQTPMFGQQITGYAGATFENGFFFSGPLVADAPVSGNSYAGISYFTDANNGYLDARDYTDTVSPGRHYVNMLINGTWSGWTTPGSAIVATTPPTLMGNGGLWFNPTANQLAVWNAGAHAWTALPSDASVVHKSGDTMTGPLIMAADPVQPLETATKEYVDTATLNVWTTGDVKLTFKTVADPGWILMNDGTFGDASSGGTTLASATAQNLFTMFYALADADVPLQTSSGAATTRAAQGTAAQAWAAHCRMSLPKAMGHLIGVAGAGVSLTPRAVASSFGQETFTLAIANLPPYTPAGAIANGAITVTLTGSGNIVGGPGAYCPGGGSYGNPQSPAGLGMSASASQAASTFTGSAQGGTSTPVNKMPPSTFLNAMVKL